ncbi:MAG: GntR family transcriptional regulator [Clostridia bacterium]
MNRKIPAYLQVYSHLRSAIEDGTYHVSEKLPSEAEMEKAYAVSRITIRRAIDLLSSDGYVYVRQGLGTIVASRSMNTSNYVTSFTDQLCAAGYTPSAKYIHASRCLIPEPIAALMGVPDAQEAVCVQRLLLASAHPIALMTSYLMPDIVPGLEQYPLAFTSLSAFLAETYGITIDVSRDVVSACTADMSQAAMLEIPVGSPLIYLNRVSFSDGMPILGDIVFINARMFALSFNLMGKCPQLPKKARLTNSAV